MFLPFLNKPYPYFNKSKQAFASDFLIGLFIASFLIVFQPFGINLWLTNHKILKLLGFGLISFLVSSLSRILMPVIVRDKTLGESWTILKEILSILTILACIALCNMLYGRLLGIMPVNFYAYLMVFTFTVLLGIFPVSLHVILKHNRMLKQNLQQSDALNRQLQQNNTFIAEHPKPLTESGTMINPEPEMLMLSAENEKDGLHLSLNQLLYIESADNYSTIVFIENGNRKKQLLRSSLKRLEAKVNHHPVVRCHRAYIVNLGKIKSVEGNAAGYKLSLTGCEDVIPVSRNYITALNEHLKAFK